MLAATALLEKSFTASSSQKPLSTPTTDVRLIATPSTGKDFICYCLGSKDIDRLLYLGTTTASEETDQENDLDVAGQASRLAAFNEAYDCLGMKSSELLKKGITISIDLQKVQHIQLPYEGAKAYLCIFLDVSEESSYITRGS